MTSTSPSLDDLEGCFAEQSFVRALAESLLFDRRQQVDDVVQQTWLEAVRRVSAAAPAPRSLRGFLASVVRSRAGNARCRAASTACKLTTDRRERFEARPASLVMDAGGAVDRVLRVGPAADRWRRSRAAHANPAAGRRKASPGALDVRIDAG